LLVKSNCVFNACGIHWLLKSMLFAKQYNKKFICKCM
jgi:hypothetical protein